MLDFSKVEVAKVANPRGPSATPVVRAPKPPSPYQIKVDYTESQIEIGKQLFTELDLENNSASEGSHPDLPNTVLFVVHPGNTGKFLKKVENAKDKGRKFKNNNLVANLTKAGLTGGFFNLEILGQDESNVRYYKFVAYVPAEGEDTSAELSEGPSDESDISL